MAAFADEYTTLRSLGNDFFVNGDFAKAEEIYSDIILKFDKDLAIIHTNRSAARLSLNRVDEALEDAQKAIEIDSQWMKAYYRKASALDILKRPKEVFDTWMEAAEKCDAESSPWLAKQLHNARHNWSKEMRNIAVSDEDDFITRYDILTDSREKLSTMAHFWNDSTLAERIHHFHFLISLIGGESDQSMQNKYITEENMPAMPLHNYEDLPRSNILVWCEFFLSLSSESKTKVMERMWETLSNDEQTAVITDLKLFISMAVKSERDATVAACRDAVPKI